MATLHRVAADLREHLAQPATLIGSAAACLAGADVEVADIDLLVTTDDAIRLESAWASHRIADYAPACADRFRSRFSRYAFAPLPVEVMGDLDVRVDDGWVRLAIAPVRPVDGLGHALGVPSIAEQQRVLALFGRDKDRVRAAQLERLAQAGATP